MARNNLAYDLNRYEKKETAPPIKKIRTSEKAAAKPVNLFAVFVILFAVIALTFSMIYTRVKLNEVGIEISSAQKLLEKQESDRVRLLTKLESEKSLTNIEDYARNELGMVKPDGNQIKHFSVTKGNKIELLEREKPNLLSRIEKLFVNFMEYISP